MRSSLESRQLRGTLGCTAGGEPLLGRVILQPSATTPAEHRRLPCSPAKSVRRLACCPCPPTLICSSFAWYCEAAVASICSRRSGPLLPSWPAPWPSSPRLRLLAR
eukprot:contig_8759_g2060